jgi:hypothetical protein
MGGSPVLAFPLAWFAEPLARLLPTDSPRPGRQTSIVALSRWAWSCGQRPGWGIARPSHASTPNMDMSKHSSVSSGIKIYRLVLAWLGLGPAVVGLLTGNTLSILRPVPVASTRHAPCWDCNKQSDSPISQALQCTRPGCLLPTGYPPPTDAMQSPTEEERLLICRNKRLMNHPSDPRCGSQSMPSLASRAKSCWLRQHHPKRQFRNSRSQPGPAARRAQLLNTAGTSPFPRHC